MFAEIALNPGGVIAWLIAGLIGGWLTGVVMKGGGYGIIWDIILGLIGAFIGGWITGLFVEGDMGFWGTVVVAFVGGCILVAIARAFSPGPRVP